MKVLDGFHIADSMNLPKVDYLMLMEYMHESNCYNSSETRNAKALFASQEAYVDSAVGYVQVKREANLCIVQCRVTLENSVKARLHQVTAVINESIEKISKIQCGDCAASAGGCKHAICFTMWLIKRSDEPSQTPTIFYWSKPKFARASGNQNFILAKNIVKMKRPVEDVKIDITLSMFLEECKRRQITTGIILKYCGNYQST